MRKAKDGLNPVMIFSDKGKILRVDLLPDSNTMKEITIRSGLFSKTTTIVFRDASEIVKLDGRK